MKNVEITVTESCDPPSVRPELRQDAKPKGSQHLAAVHVPQLQPTFGDSRAHKNAIVGGRKLHLKHEGVVTSEEGAEYVPRRRVPHANRQIFAPARQPRPVRRERNRCDPVSQFLQHQFRLPCLGVPQDHREGSASGGKRLSARRERHHLQSRSVRVYWAPFIQQRAVTAPGHPAEARSCSVVPGSGHAHDTARGVEDFPVLLRFSHARHESAVW
mmetsp:Transcript_19987/g.48408  ORF Transcript_19987/g.48408 Transcript_19987/m.48408 type:complete len:215 (-) Transcript_19987:282-926(-)